MFDWRETILSQYSNSPTITTLIEGIAELIDPTPDLEVFYKNIFDPSTATGIGIKIWARIVAMNYVNGVDTVEGEFLGFDETSELFPYDRAPFFNNTQGVARQQFNDISLRTLVKSKALANIGNATLPVIKEFLKTVLGSNQFAVDNVRSTAGGGGFVYHPVTPEDDDNPSAKGWYELKRIDNKNVYVLTTDTTVDKTKTYYVQGTATMAVKFVISGTKPVTMQLFRIYAPIVVGAGVKIYWQITGATFFGFDGNDLASPFGQGVFPEMIYQEAKPTTGDNPDDKNWYEKIDDVYIHTTDKTVNPTKTYYEKVPDPSSWNYGTL